MTLDHTKKFLIVTEEAVIKGHFTFYRDSAPKGAFFYCPDRKKRGISPAFPEREGRTAQYHRPAGTPIRALRILARIRMMAPPIREEI